MSRCRYFSLALSRYLDEDIGDGKTEIAIKASVVSGMEHSCLYNGLKMLNAT